MVDTTKILALYLPQFHETEHNNEWWGKGFTDWIAAKKAEPLFKGHQQPVIPYNGEYYDLLKKETMQRQAALSKEYGIDGFVFYHYYFGDGQLELERPAENLLKWEDVDMPYCFSWANQSWIRSWSKIVGNVWGEKIEQQRDDYADGILIEQTYGGESQWRAHFEYLLPFFCDDRYIKIDGKPVFFFFDPSSISCIKEMMAFWNELARRTGIEGIYYVANRIYSNEIGFDAIMLNECGITLKEMHRNGEMELRNGVRCFDYGQYLDHVIKTKPIDNTKTIFSVSVGYDSTPRRGVDGECIINRSPKDFMRCVKDLLCKSIYYENEFMLINAWNEWGEGMHLEPDKEDGFGYLEAVFKAKQDVASMNEKDILLRGEQIKDSLSDYDEQAFLLSKFQYYVRVYSKWIDLTETRKQIFRDILEEDGVESVAIYGYYDMGKKLERRLEKEKINVLFAIDQVVGSTKNGTKVYRPEDDFPEVACIIITAYDPVEIRKKLKDGGRNEKIYSIMELLEKSTKEGGI